MKFQNFFSFSQIKIVKQLGLTVALTFAALSSSIAMAEPLLLTQIESLESRYHELSSNFYQIIAQGTKNNKLINSNKALSKQVRKLEKENKANDAISLIQQNLKTIFDNINDQEVLSILEVLLKHNDFQTANKIYLQILSTNEQFLILNASIKFAKYHIDRHEWQQSLSFLNSEFKQLSSTSISSAYFYKGLAMQNLKKHREAIEMYEKVSKDSSYYHLAKINSAIGLIRQDWWTEAHMIIKELLNDKTILDNEINNRLYLVLGYSLLNKQYFRESRDAFRNISLDSQYANRALMGLSLAAMNQADELGALNTLSILNKKKSLDLVVEESYLLMPYLNQKIEQFASANTGYTEAIIYYQERIEELSKEIRPSHSAEMTHIIMNSNLEMTLANTLFKFTDIYPRYFLDNLQNLQQFKLATQSKDLNQKLEKLISEYHLVFNQIINLHLRQRIKELESYLNQSNYGLAQLYDTNDE